MNKILKFLKKNKYWILGILILVLAVALFIIFKGRINMFQNTAIDIPVSSGGGTASSGSLTN
jgi:hypothetical protein